MNKLKKHLENKKGFVAIKNMIALIFVWLLGSSPLNRGHDKKHKIEDNLRKLLALSY